MAKTVKKIVLWIITTLSLTVLLASLSLAVVLKRGLQIDSMSYDQVVVSGISLLWKDKLEVEIDSVSLTDRSGEKEKSKKTGVIKKGITTLRWLTRLFSKCDIGHLQIGDKSVAFSLQEKENNTSHFTLLSGDISVQATLLSTPYELIVDSIETTGLPFNVTISGQIKANTKTELIKGEFTANRDARFPLIVEFTADSRGVAFHGKEGGRISEISPLVDLFGLSHGVQRWITEYLQGSRFHVNAFRGEIPWGNPGAFLDTLFAEVVVDDTEYIFAQGFDPVKAASTNVVFSNGVLHIYPHEATFYDQSLGESTVAIDFNDLTKIPLSVHLKTRAELNEDILALLDHYKIPLPFYQSEGTTEVDLTLIVNLKEQQVSSYGTFLIDESTIEFGGKEYRVDDGRIRLENSEVAIEQLMVSFAEMFTAMVSGTYQARTGEGDFTLLPDHLAMEFGKSRLKLDSSLPSPTIRYQFKPGTHTIESSLSFWYLDGSRMQLAPFIGQLSTEDLLFDFPPTELSIFPGVRMNISGSLALRDEKAEIGVELLQYHVKDFQLTSPSVPATVSFDKKIHIRTEATSEWLLNTIPIVLSPVTLKYGDDILSMESGRIQYGKMFDSRVAGFYDKSLKRGEFQLKNLHIYEKNITEQLDLRDGGEGEIRNEDDGFVVEIPELGLEIKTDREKRWSATFKDLARINSRSQFLQQYNINAGTISVSLGQESGKYLFSAEFPNYYPFFYQDGTPVARLSIDGEITERGFDAVINEGIFLHYAQEQLTASSTGVDFYVPGIVDFIKDLPKSSGSTQKEKSAVDFSFNAKNTKMILKSQNKILADSFSIGNANDTFKLELQHGTGKITLNLEDGQFDIEGRELDQTFMMALFPDARIRNGTMAVAGSGTLSEFSILLRINNTILLDLKALNNILAFIDTIPALVTFSLPGYNSDGLPISSVIVGMIFKDGVATVEALDVTSPQLTIQGVGWLDFPQNLIEMDIDLTTKAREHIRKLPLLGYLLTGDEGNSSVSLELRGDLTDPIIKNSFLLNVVTSPLTLLFRTLNLPLHVIDSMTKYGDAGNPKPHSR